MPTPPLDLAKAQEALDAYTASGNNTERAAAALKQPLGTFRNRLKRAKDYGLRPNTEPPPAPEKPDEVLVQAQRIQSLQQQLRAAQGGESLAAWAKSIVHGADEQARQRKPATWLQEHQRTPSAAGIPTLLLSDLHWGETILGSEIEEANEYNLEVARERLQRVIHKTRSLLRDHVVGNYPGIVVCLGGDMISGSIHDELLQTNDGTVMSQMLDLFEHMQTAIKLLADDFGKVHLPCVTGNHG